MGIGLYIHIPFCAGKCPYCDFYSLPYDSRASYAYADAVIRNAAHYNERYNTIFFGGGTPSAAWWDVCRIMGALRFSDDAEITVEANPNSLSRDALTSMRNSGVNRLSIGVQSFSNSELKALGRAHMSEDATIAIKLAAECGFGNISVDLMLGVPGQTPESVRRSVKILAGLSVVHVSAYMLKVEAHTPFAAAAHTLPDENLTAQIYLAAADALEQNGFMQYEISNFAKPGSECRHNLKYWKSEEYLGIGAAAHSYYNTEGSSSPQRFYVNSDIREFIKALSQPILFADRQFKDDSDFTEYAMLKLRLAEGLSFKECERFGVNKAAILKRCKLVPPDYLAVTNKGVAITREGFLVSNRIIGKLTTEPAEQVI
jgi:oxygen-independent coproporphyrinogen-3 oxidase